MGVSSSNKEDSYSLRGSGDEGGSERDSLSISGSYKEGEGVVMTPEERKARRKKNLALKLSGKLQRRAIVETLATPYTNSSLPTIHSAAPTPTHGDEDRQDSFEAKGQEDAGGDGILRSLVRGFSTKIFAAADEGDSILERKASGENKPKKAGGGDGGRVEDVENDDDDMIFSMRQA